MERFSRYLVVIIGVIAITALLIYSQTVGENSQDVSSDSTPSNEQIIQSDSLEDEEHTHQAQTEWCYNAEQHWKECACLEKVQISAHEWIWAEDSSSDCGYSKQCDCGHKIIVAPTLLRQTQELYLNVQVMDENAVVHDTQSVALALDASIGNVVKVRYKGKELDFTLGANGVRLLAKEFGLDYGHSELEIITDKGYYQSPILLITKQITSKQELDEMHILSKACEAQADVYGGWFTLGADIIYNGEWTGGIAVPISESAARLGKAGFCGTFDGRGYSIVGCKRTSTNSVFDAFVGVLCGGCIQNVAFLNAEMSTSGSFVCAAGTGIIENVYVEYAAFCTKTQRYTSTFFNEWVGEGTRMQACVVDCRLLDDDAAQNALGANTYLIGYLANNDVVMDGVLQGVYVLGAPRTAKIVYQKAERTDCFGLYESVGDIQKDAAAQSQMQAWNSKYWTIQDGCPVFCKK